VSAAATARARTLIIVASSDPARVEEALRAALGLTLRGAEVAVWLDHRPSSALARRALDALRSFGHRVGDARSGPALEEMDAVEVWT
jgi:hypothetical protein